jgi:hypothetical protein
MLVQDVKIILNFYGMFMDQTYEVACIYAILRPSLPIVVILCWISDG